MDDPKIVPTKQQKESRWHRWQRGQALVEYWPTLPIGVMVMISAAAVVGPIQDAFLKTADGLNTVVCETPSTSPTHTDLVGGHRVEATAWAYDEDEDRTTVTFRVHSGDQPSISHWILGIDKETADKIVETTANYEGWKQEQQPTLKTGIKFNYSPTSSGGGGGGGGNEGGGNEDNGGKGGPPPGKGPNKKVIHTDILLKDAGKNLVLKPVYSPAYNTYISAQEITLTFTGRVDFVEEIEVTTKSGASQVSSGTITIPSTTNTTVESC